MLDDYLANKINNKAAEIIQEVNTFRNSLSPDDLALYDELFHFMYYVRRSWIETLTAWICG
jgi:hypothetical protein